MIYGSVISESLEVVILSGDSLDEQMEFISRIENETPALIQETDFSRIFSDPHLSRFKRPPTILKFDELNTLDAWLKDNNIEVHKLASGAQMQERMLFAEQFRKDDQRTIAEIHGITDENDPWSHRTDEQKAKAAAVKKQMTAKRKAGEITNDSFGGGEKTDKEGINIRDVSVEVGDDGEFEFGNVLADKGLFGVKHFHLMLPQNDIALYTDVIKRAGLLNENDYPCEWEKHADEGIVIHTTTAGAERIRQALEGVEYTFEEIKENVSTVTPEWKIADDEMIAIYFRVDVPNRTMSEITPIMDADGLRAPFKSRDVDDFGCWMAFVREQGAAKVIALLADNGIESKLAEVNANGERIVEEGADVTVIDTGADEVEPPLPWNEGAAAFAALDEKAQRKSLRGKYLLYTIRDYEGTGLIIHITPRSWFREHHNLWPGELPIDHLLPPNVERYTDAPGMYRCRSLDMNATDFMLGNKAHMHESLPLRAYCNMLPNGDQRGFEARLANG